MNKKQLIVAWVMGIFICVMLFMHKEILFMTHSWVYGTNILGLKIKGDFYEFRYSAIIASLILGSLLIYSLRKKV